MHYVFFILQLIQMLGTYVVRILIIIANSLFLSLSIHTFQYILTFFVFNSFIILSSVVQSIYHVFHPAMHAFSVLPCSTQSAFSLIITHYSLIIRIVVTLYSTIVVRNL